MLFVHAGIYSTTEWPHKDFHTLEGHSEADSQAWKEQILRATQQQHAIPSSQDFMKNVRNEC